MNTYAHLRPDSGDRSQDAGEAAPRAEPGQEFGNPSDSLRTSSHPGQSLA